MTPLFPTLPAGSRDLVLDVSFDGRGSAIFSSDRTHRYALTRVLDVDLFAAPEHPVVFFVGLNPSSAGASKDDVTITKECGFATLLGAAALVKVNLYSVILTDSRRLDEMPTPLGPDFDEVLALVEEIACRPGVMTRTILAWGSHPMATGDRISKVLESLPGPFECYGATRDGSPRHTSRLPYATRLERWGV